MYRFILDNIFTCPDTEVEGWDGLITSLVRDKEKKGILKTQDAKLSFIGTSYDYLIDKFYSEGYCNEIKIDIQEYYKGAWKTIYNGIIKVPAFEIEEDYKITTPVEDNSFYSRINNNKNIGNKLFSAKSKNNVDITAAAGYQIEMFRPSDGVAYPPVGAWGLTGYRVFEAFRSIIHQISDNEVDFASDLFDVGGELEGLAIINGYTLRFLEADPWLEEDFKNNLTTLSFEDLFTEVYKIKNIAFKIELGGAKPVLRIEKADTLFSKKNTDIVFRDIDHIKTYTHAKELYSILRIGGDSLNESEVNATPLSFASSAEFTGFKREDWTIAGQCNVDLPFDLQGEFVRDSNVIEDVIVHKNGNFDDRWFFVETTYNGANSGTAIKGDPFGAGVDPFSYNPGLRNSETLNNFYGYVPNSIVQHLTGNTGGLYKAVKETNIQIYSLTGGGNFITNPTVYFQVNPEDDGTGNYPADVGQFDDGNNYDPVTGDYTVPFGGQFSFTAVSRVIAQSNNTRYYIVFALYTSGGTLKVYNEFELNPQNVGQIYTFTRSVTYVCNGTDKVRVFHRARKLGGFGQTPYGLLYLQGSTLECTAIQGQGGELLGGDPQDYRANRHEFEYPLTKEQFETIEANSTDSYEFYKHGQNPKKGFIDNVKYNHKDRMAKITLQSSFNTNA